MIEVSDSEKRFISLFVATLDDYPGSSTHYCSLKCVVDIGFFDHPIDLRGEETQQCSLEVQTGPIRFQPFIDINHVTKHLYRPRKELNHRF
jgi:hypothetical protein